MKRLITSIFALSLFSLSCEEKTEFLLQNNDLSFLVVEGTITNELTNHRIILSHPHPGINETSIPASGAIVTISDGTNEVSLTEQPIGSGEYDSVIC